MENIYSTIIRPVLTEKNMKAQESDPKKYAFLIRSNNKIEVKQAVETLYQTTVESVNIIPVRKKQRMVGKGKVMTTRPAGRKAIVTLKKGLSIDVMNIKSEKEKK